MHDQKWIADFIAVNGAGSIVPLEAAHQAELAPAEYCVFEWTEYALAVAGADSLMVGSTRISPRFPGSFIFSFSNQLGLAKIVPMDGNVPVGSPLHVEVLSSKLGTPGQSLAFAKALLSELFASGSSLPFVAAAPTVRWVRDSTRPPNDLFVYHFFRGHRERVMRAVQAILGSPHRVLSDEERFVRPHEVRQIEPDSILRMLQSGRARAGAQKLTPIQRLRPERVHQRIPLETFDTPENRFVLSAGRRMISAIEHLEQRLWYRKDPVTERNRRGIAEVKEHLSMLTLDPRFDMVVESMRFPFQSRVLQRKDGYREATLLWQQFHRARSPIFQQLETAIDLRDIATMYELWALFRLIADIRIITEVEPIISDSVNEFGNPEYRFNATFPGFGVLHYNKSYSGYSGISLHPDYVWELPNGDLIVIDAKFRLHKFPDMFGKEVSVPLIQAAEAKDDDFQKMHTYRDAIARVRAALVVYPGTESLFRTANGSNRLITLEHVISGELDGIGAIPMSPVIGDLTQ